jgi:hypothetical protein
MSLLSQAETELIQARFAIAALEEKLAESDRRAAIAEAHAATFAVKALGKEPHCDICGHPVEPTVCRNCFDAAQCGHL